MFNASDLITLGHKCAGVAAVANLGKTGVCIVSLVGVERASIAWIIPG